MLTRNLVAKFIIASSFLLLGYLFALSQESRWVDSSLIIRAKHKIDERWRVKINDSVGIFGEYRVSQIDFGFENCVQFTPSGYFEYGSSFTYCESPEHEVTKIQIL